MSNLGACGCLSTLFVDRVFMIWVSLLKCLLSRPNIILLLIFAADCSLVDNRRLKAMAGQRAEFWFSAVTFLLL